MQIKALFQGGDIRFRRWNDITNEVDLNSELIDIQPAQQLSLYTDTVIAEEVLDQKFEVKRLALLSLFRAWSMILRRYPH